MSALPVATAGATAAGADNFTTHYDDPLVPHAYPDCGVHTIPLYPEFRATQALVTVLYPILLVLGTVGNTLCVVALSHLSEVAWSSCLYVAVVSLVELFILYIRCGGTWLMTVAGMNPSFKVMTSSDAMCKIYLFLLNVLLEMWPWLMVALSVELLISTKFPLKTYRMCTTERARAIILLITILLVCLNLNFFWTWGLLEGQVCIYIEVHSEEFLDLIWPSIEMAVQHILPLIVVSVAFLVSVVSLLQAGRSGAPSYEPVLKRYFLDLQALQQLKLAALIAVLFFLVVKTFTFIVELLNALESKEMFIVPCEHYAQYRARFLLVQTVRDALVYCFHSLKFFVYFSCCASFRRQVFSIFRKVFCCCRPQRNALASASMLKSKADCHLEQIEEIFDHGDISHVESTGLQDLNGVQPMVMNKTTHV